MTSSEIIAALQGAIRRWEQAPAGMAGMADDLIAQAQSLIAAEQAATETQPCYVCGADVDEQDETDVCVNCAGGDL